MYRVGGGACGATRLVRIPVCRIQIAMGGAVGSSLPGWITMGTGQLRSNPTDRPA